jgi:hypothetical protein
MIPGVIYQSRECSTLLLWKTTKGSVLAFSKINGDITLMTNPEPSMGHLTETPFQAQDLGLKTLDDAYTEENHETIIRHTAMGRHQADT